MASKKAAKEKTYPKVQGDGEGHNSDDFVPPDRPDVIARDPSDPSSEEVDVFANEDDAGARREPPPRDEGGDARQMRTEEGDDDEGERRGRRSSREAPESRKVRQRINRERALRRESDEKVTNLTAKLSETEQRLAKLEQSQAQVASSSSVREIEAKIAETKKALEKAIEDGDTARQLDLQMQMAEAVADLKILKKTLTDDARQREHQQQQQQTTDQSSGPDQEVRRSRIKQFQDQNRGWWGKRKFGDENQDAVSIDNDILADIKDGRLDFDPYSPEHFEELAARMQEFYPDLEIRMPDGELYEPDDEDADMRDDEDSRDSRRRPTDTRSGSRLNGARQNGRAPMGGMGGREGRRQQNAVELAKQGRVQLTEDDFANMRRFNLDPNNPDHKKRFANERRRTILTGDRRR